MDYRKQVAARKRAEKSGDVSKVAQTTARAVAEWNSPEGYWPDDWSAWQRALDDAMPPGQFGGDIAELVETTNEAGDTVILFDSFAGKVAQR